MEGVFFLLHHPILVTQCGLKSHRLLWTIRQRHYVPFRNVNPLGCHLIVYIILSILIIVHQRFLLNGWNDLGRLFDSIVGI